MPDPFCEDERHLLAAVHSDPKSDLPRLVYADWLDDHGQADYAEFIRLQCHAARGCPDPLAPPVTPREIALLRRHRDEWARPFIRAQRQDGFARGLPVFQLPLKGAEFRRRLAQAHRYGSPRHCLKLFLWPEDAALAARLIEHPLMVRVHFVVIQVAWQFGGEAYRSRDLFRPLLDALAACPRIDRLSWMAVANCGSSPGLRQLVCEAFGFRCEVL